MSTYRTLRDALNQAGDVLKQAEADARDADALLAAVERRKSTEDRRISPKFACPGCGHFRSEVIESVSVAETTDQGLVRRRRACLECEGRYTTVERVILASFEPAKKSA